MGSRVRGVGVMLWDLGISGKGSPVSVSRGLELVEPSELSAALARCVPLLLSPYPQDGAKDVRML